MRRRTFSTLVFFIFLLAGINLYLEMPPPGHNITVAGLKAIRVGMTKAEVEAILRRPPGHYGPGVAVFNSFPESTLPPKERTLHQWAKDGLAIAVEFNGEGKVWSMWG